jgi:hypothetical protein
VKVQYFNPFLKGAKSGLLIMYIVLKILASKGGGCGGPLRPIYSKSSTAKHQQ